MHVYEDASFAIMEYIQQGSLLDVINAYKQKGQKMDESIGK